MESLSQLKRVQELEAQVAVLVEAAREVLKWSKIIDDAAGSGEEVPGDAYQEAFDGTLRKLQRAVTALPAATKAHLERDARMEQALDISPDDTGRIMHESWTKTKRSQGFHHPDEAGHGITSNPCAKCHPDLIAWDDLPERQKDINRHAFDAVLAEIRQRAALAAQPATKEVQR